MRDSKLDESTSAEVLSKSGRWAESVVCERGKTTDNWIVTGQPSPQRGPVRWMRHGLERTTMGQGRSGCGLAQGNQHDH